MRPTDMGHGAAAITPPRLIILMVPVGPAVGVPVAAHSAHLGPDDLAIHAGMVAQRNSCLGSNHRLHERSRPRMTEAFVPADRFWQSNGLSYPLL